jgi:hypothetical protein
MYCIEQRRFFEYSLCFVASLPNYVQRPFDLVRQDLEDTLARIEDAFSPKDRRTLLKQLRELLEEADGIIQAEE